MPARKRRVPVGQFVVDRDVQRQAYVESTLAEIRANYDRDLLGQVVLSERPDGSLVVLDGAHRAKVTEEVLGPDALIDCKVHTALTKAQEARIFRQLNVGKPPSRVDDFFVMVTEDDPAALAVKKAVHDSGIGRIGPRKGDIKAVATLMGIVHKGSAFTGEDEYGYTLLYNVLHVLARAWGNGDPVSTEPTMLNAVAGFYLGVQRYEAAREVDLKLSYERLADNLRDFTNGPSAMMAAARAVKLSGSKTLRRALMSQLFEVYNKGRGGKKLPLDLEATLK